MKKIIVSCLSLILVLAGCTSTTNNIIEEKETFRNAYEEIHKDDIGGALSLVELSADLCNEDYIFDNVPIVALVQIESIDRGSNYNFYTDEYTYPFTVGKMTIETVIKGDLTVGDTVEYVRSGGIITYEEYLNGESFEDRERIKQLSANSTNQPYMHFSFDGDVPIVPGKKYLVYLDSLKITETSEISYSIQYFQSGLRKLSGDIGDIETLKFYNNCKGKWESINSIIK